MAVGVGAGSSFMLVMNQSFPFTDWEEVISGVITNKPASVIDWLASNKISLLLSVAN